MIHCVQQKSTAQVSLGKFEKNSNGGLYMPTTQRPYEFITEKIRAIKDAYPSLRSRSDAYSFSALCIKSSFYKNPALVLNESGFEDMIVDGPYDGGVDILLSDPNTEGADLVIGQSKFYTSIQYDDVLNAMTKMALFYQRYDSRPV